MLHSKIKAKSLFGITLAAFSTAIAFQSPTNAQKVKNVSKELIEAADLVNQHLPVNIDPTVRWDSTKAGPGKLMNYNYTLLQLSAAQIDGNVLNQQFTPFVNNLLCNNPSSQFFRDNDVTLNVNIYDNQRSLVSRVKVSTSECS